MAESESMAFGALLRRYRLAASLSQEALAERAGISVDAVASLERGRRTRPRLDTVSLLADALGLDGDARSALIDAAHASRQAANAAVSTADSIAARDAEALPSDASPTTSAAEPARGARLPIPPTPIVCREREEAELVTMFETGTRLVTLMGPGGVGKTRLALQVASNLIQRFVDGVIFVDLAPLRDVSLVASAIAQNLGGGEVSGQSAGAVLSGLLDGKQVLLVLDNFEQIVAAAPLIGELLATHPKLAVLVTSRIALRLRAEQQYRVTPLSLPPSTWSSSDELLASGAVQLFVARARTVQPGFTLDVHNGRSVADICCRLDGLPLAIELAAARIRLLPPAALLARLERRLGMLTRGPRDVPERQQTLRATLDWSFDLLSPADRRLFARLSVFSEGCTLDAIEAVCNPDGDLDVWDGVTTLVESSLIVETAGSETTEPRFGMLETVREYARERLEEVGDVDRLQRAHLCHFVHEIEPSLPDLDADQKAWLSRWEREHENVRTALRRARDRGEIELGLRLAGVAWKLWWLHGHLTEGRAWLGVLLGMSDGLPPGLRARALHGAAALALAQGDETSAARRAEEALPLFREIGDNAGTAEMLNLLGIIARDEGDCDRATALFEEGAALYRHIGDVIGVGACLSNLGTTARLCGNFDAAATLYEEALRLRRQGGDRPGTAFILTNLGDLARDRGDGAAAHAAYAEALGISNDLGDPRGSARAALGLAGVARDRGDVDGAAARYTEALDLARTIHHPEYIESALAGLVWSAQVRGEPLPTELCGFI